MRKLRKVIDARTKELEDAMDLLIRKHPTPSSIEDLYLYISSYAHCHEEWEDRYCKRYLMNRVRTGYLRTYDDGR